MVQTSAFAAVALAIANAVTASPRIALPINSQVPPVAVASEPFSFTFAQSTFTSDSDDVKYSVSSAPSWLRLDSNSRTFSGRPTNDDDGFDTFNLTATDSGGSTDMTVTFAVSSEPGPRILKPLAAQLPLLGQTSDSTTISLYPEATFNVTFASDTFNDNSSALNCYATSSNNTPLPSWVDFDGGALRFSGETPALSSLNTQPQTFSFKLIASNVPGFAGTSTVFGLTVGAHKLVFKRPIITVEVAPGDSLNFTGLQDQLTLDGRAVETEDLLDVSTKKPSWVTFDQSSLALRGTVPRQAMSGNVTVTARDDYGDVATAVVKIEIRGNLFTRSIGPLNATAGEEFTYDVGSAIDTDSDVMVSADIDSAASWLTFDSKKLTLQGNVPDDEEVDNIDIEITATSSTDSRSNTQKITISLQEKQIAPTKSSKAPSSSTMSPAAFSSGAGGRQTDVAAADDTGTSKTTIAIAVVVPICFLALVGLLVVCCCVRRNRKGHETPQDSPDRGFFSSPARDGELWPDAARTECQDIDEPQRLPALDAILKEGLSLRFSQDSSTKLSMDGEGGIFRVDRQSLRETSAESKSDYEHGVISLSPRSKISKRQSSRTEHSPRRRVSMANRLLAMYSTEWTDETGSTAHYRSSGACAESISDVSVELEESNYSREPSNSLKDTSNGVFNSPGGTPAYGASNSFRAHGPPKSKTGSLKTPRDPLGIPLDTEKNKFLRHVSGRSPFFGGSARASFISRKSSRSKLFAPLQDSPTLPRTPLPREQPTSLLPGALTGSSEQTIPEGGSSVSDSRKSYDQTNWERASSRALGSRLSYRLSRLSHQMGNLSSHFQSGVSSPGSRFDSKFVDSVDEEGQRHWRNESSVEAGSNNSPVMGKDSRGSFFAYSEDQDFESGLGIRSLHSPRDSPKPPYEKAVLASSSRGAPRLVEFKAKRPVSMDDAISNGRTRESSHSGSYAFV